MQTVWGFFLSNITTLPDPVSLRDPVEAEIAQEEDIHKDLNREDPEEIK